MKKYKVPYSVIISGEFEVQANSEGQANVSARRWLGKGDTKEMHRMLLKAGVGSIRIHSGHILEVATEEAPSEWTGQRFQKEKK